jgi:threonine/homoserine/homoserine lactone efflux protein
LVSTLFNGFILGWSVAWPPGPVNAEMIRRGLLPRQQGGGFWSAWRVGLGACSADFLWALAVTAGAGALLNKPQVRISIAVVSLGLLVILAIFFSLAAWKTARQGQDKQEKPGVLQAAANTGSRGGYLLGFIFALSSPWNIGFWLAVIGSQQAMTMPRSFFDSLTLACAVVLGAIVWTIVLCAAVRSGARVFARPSWQVWTQVLTAAVMIYFAVRLAFQLYA